MAFTCIVIHDLYNYQDDNYVNFILLYDQTLKLHVIKNYYFLPDFESVSKRVYKPVVIYFTNNIC